MRNKTHSREADFVVGICIVVMVAVPFFAVVVAGIAEALR